MQENLLTAVQVARYLKVDKFTVYRLVAQKKLPAFRVGSQWRFNRKIIEEWLLKTRTCLPLARLSDVRDVAEDRKWVIATATDRATRMGGSAAW